jgi:hypothetical protein
VGGGHGDHGAGAGAGGYRESHCATTSGYSPLAAARPVSIQSYPITVVQVQHYLHLHQVGGSSSSFSTITSAGGGGGAVNAGQINGGSGGSGGGGTTASYQETVSGNTNKST